MRFSSPAAAALAAAFLFAASLASPESQAAVVVDFDDVIGFNNVSNGTYSEDGFNFSFSSGSFIHSVNNINSTGFPSEPLLELDSATATITRDGGALFDFNSVLAVQSGDTTPLSFIGTFADNSTIVANVFAPLAQVPGAGTLVFSGFVDIKSLQISSIGLGNSFALYDDFTFDGDSVSSVPGPGAFLLLGVGLLGLGMRRRTA